MPEYDISKITIDDTTYNLKKGTRDAGEVDISKITLPDGTVCNIKGSSNLTTKTITSNGTYNAQDDSADGYSSVVVNVPNSPETVQTVTATYLQDFGYIRVRNDGYDFKGVDKCCIFGNFGIQLTNASSSYQFIDAGTTLLTLTGIEAPVNRTSNFDFYDTSGNSFPGSRLAIDSNPSTNEIYIKTVGTIPLSGKTSLGFWGGLNIWFT